MAEMESLRRRKDRLARWTVTSGGLAILLAMAGMMGFIVVQVAPLWRPPRAEPVGTVVPADAVGVGGVAERVSSAPMAVVVDEYQEYAVVIYRDGRADAVRLADGTVATSWTVVPPRKLASSKEGSGADRGRGETQIVAVDVHPERDVLTAALADGRIVPVEVNFSVTYPQGRRLITPSVDVLEPVSLAPEGTPLVAAVYRPLTDGWIAAALTGGPGVVLKVQERRQSLLGPARVTETVIDLTDDLEGRQPTAVTVDPAGQYLVVGDADGGITVWQLRRRSSPQRIGRVRAGEVPITQLTFLMGGRSLVVAGADGRITRWLPAAEPGVPGGRQFTLVNGFAAHGAPIVKVGVSRRVKGFATIDAGGGWALHHATTGQTQITVERGAQDVSAAALAPRGDGVLLVDSNGRIARWSIVNPHPEVAWNALFGKVWYEGYDEPAYVWQSSGGSDAFEPKLSLIPLLFGTIKGTVYALLLAVPVAILGAVYTAHFMEPRWRALVKPVVELMAGLPSVVLGMLGGLWMAPWLERNLPGVVVASLLAPSAMLILAALWGRLPATWRNRLPAGRVVVAAIPALILTAWIGLAVGPVVEQWFMENDFRQWLLETAGVRFDQRNSLVVAFAMGFAVIPIIFSISEDALSSVPGHLVAGSLALGATPWETVRRVVLPVAGPAIFSAVMIGFGRAVGETMIVLMATGNTPVMDLGVFTGFRTLAANVAVEMPEAPVGGTLYRVLFLSALLLLGVTFIVNTAAEMVRLRLRRRYAQL